MKILAIETATDASSVALGDDSGLHAMALNVDGKGHVAFLIPAIDFCFQQANWSIADLEVVAVDVGPGRYTGLRAGLATAQSIAAAAGVPIVVLSALDVLALGAATGRRTIWPIVDVRRGQVATAPYRTVPGGVVTDGPTEIMGPSEFAGRIAASANDALVVGDHSVLPQSCLASLRRVRLGRPRHPSAEVALRLAEMRVASGRYSAPEEVRPMYLREPDVAINWTDFREEGVWPGELQ